MKTRNRSESCSCTTCVNRSDSDSPPIKRLLELGSRIDRLYVGKYIPLRERKLLKKLVRTRAVYDDIRAQIVSDSTVSTKGDFNPIKKVSNKEFDDTEKSSAAVLELVNIVDKGAIGSKKLDECCSCCSCSSKTKIYKRSFEKYRHRRPYASANKYDAEERLRAYRERREAYNRKKPLRHTRFKTKLIRSDPCTCTFKLVKKQSKALLKKMHTKPPLMFSELQPSNDIELNQKSRRISDFAQKSYENLAQSKIRMKEKISEGITKIRRSQTRLQEKIELQKQKSLEKFNEAKDNFASNLRASVQRINRITKKDESQTVSNQNLFLKIKKDSIRKFKDDQRRKQIMKYWECEPECIEGTCVPKECFHRLKLNRFNQKNYHHSGINYNNRTQERKVGKSMGQTYKVQTRELAKAKTIKTQKPILRAQHIKESRITFDNGPKVKLGNSSLEDTPQDLQEGQINSLYNLKSHKNKVEPEISTPDVRAYLSKNKKTKKRHLRQISSQTKYKKSPKYNQIGGHALKRCFCTLKLKAKGTKSKIKSPVTKQAMTINKSNSTFKSAINDSQMNTVSRNKRTKAKNVRVKSDHSHERGRDHKPVVENGIIKQGDPNTNLNRQVVGVRSSMSFNIEFYKDSPHNGQQITGPSELKSLSIIPKQKVALKDRGFQESARKVHRDTSMINKERNAGIGSTFKNCFCNLKSQTKEIIKKHKKNSFATGTKIAELKQIDTSNKSTKTKSGYSWPLKPYECEPYTCISGECDPYVCLERINKRTTRLKEVGLNTDHSKKSLSSSSNTYPEKNLRSVQVQYKPTYKQRKALKVKTQKSEKYNENKYGAVKSAVKIGSTFSFDIEIYKNKSPTKAKKQIDGNITKSNTKKHKRQDNEIKMNRLNVAPVETRVRGPWKRQKGSVVEPILKKCFCTLNLQKKRKPQYSETAISQSGRLFFQSPLVYTINKTMIEGTQFTRNMYQIPLHNSFHRKLNNHDQLDKMATKVEHVNNIRDEKRGLHILYGQKWDPDDLKFRTEQETLSLTQQCKENFKIHPQQRVKQLENIQKSIYTTDSQKNSKPYPHIRQTHLSSLSRYFQRCPCVMNLELENRGNFKEHEIISNSELRKSKKRSYKLKPYECEQGVCVTGEFNPHECQKKIAKRLSNKSGTEDTSGSMSSQPMAKYKGNKQQTFTQKTTKPRNYKETLQNKQKQAIGISSSFSFDIQIPQNLSSSSFKGILKSPSFFCKCSSFMKKIQRTSFGKNKNVKKETQDKKMNTGKIQDKPILCKQDICLPHECDTYDVKTDRCNGINHFVKRCFCTLELNDDSKHSHKDKRKEKDNHNLTKLKTKSQMTDEKKNLFYNELLPFECDPNICTGYQCDPYNCEKIIKSQTSKSKHFHRLVKQTPHKYSNEGMGKSKQSVTIGSTFSFDIEFLKKKQHNEKKSSNYDNDVFKEQTKNTRKRITNQTHICNEGTQFHNMGSGVKKIGVLTKPKTENKRTTTMKIPMTVDHVSPFECDPFNCLPKECVPCKEIIKLREDKNTKMQWTRSELRSQKRVGNKSNVKSQRNFIDTDKSVPRLVNVPRFKNIFNKQAVRISSNISFNIEFYKKTLPEAALSEPGHDKTVKQRSKRNNRNYDSVLPRLRSLGSNYDIIKTQSKSTQKDNILKRCICTLKLHNRKHNMESTASPFTQNFNVGRVAVHHNPKTVSKGIYRAAKSSVTKIDKKYPMEQPCSLNICRDSKDKTTAKNPNNVSFSLDSKTKKHNMPSKTPFPQIFNVGRVAVHHNSRMPSKGTNLSVKSFGTKIDKKYLQENPCHPKCQGRKVKTTNPCNISFCYGRNTVSLDNLETILPYAPEKFNKTVSKTVVSQQNTYKKQKKSAITYRRERGKIYSHGNLDNTVNDSKSNKETSIQERNTKFNRIFGTTNFFCCFAKIFKLKSNKKDYCEPCGIKINKKELYNAAGDQIFNGKNGLREVCSDLELKKPLFEMHLDSENYDILNKDQVAHNVSKLKVKCMKKPIIEMQIDSKKFNILNKEALFNSVMRSNTKGKQKGMIRINRDKSCPCPQCVCASRSIDGSLRNKCTCGSPICGNKKKIKKKSQSHPCTCGAPSCLREYKRMKAKAKRKKKNVVKRHDISNKIKQKKRQKVNKMLEKKIDTTSSTGVLMMENLIDIGNYGVTATTDMLRQLAKCVSDPKHIYRTVQDMKQNPQLAVDMLKSKGQCKELRATLRRVRLRCFATGGMQELRYKYENNPLSSYLMFKKSLQSGKKIKKHPPPKRKNALCDYYMASFRKKPCLLVYKMCPWLYPHLLSFIHVWKQFVEISLFVMAAVVWSPCILCIELCRFCTCCFLCTG